MDAGRRSLLSEERSTSACGHKEERLYSNNSAQRDTGFSRVQGKLIIVYYAVFGFTVRTADYCWQLLFSMICVAMMHCAV